MQSYKGKLIYLASPYSHPDPIVRESRFKRIANVAARLMEKGHFLFCPITHTHPINEAGINSPGWDFWAKYDYAMLDRCQELWIADMPGWKESVGVNAEIVHMELLQRPIYVFNHCAVCDGKELNLEKFDRLMLTPKGRIH